MFSDRFLYPRLFLACLLLWGSCIYCRFEGERRYPSASLCMREPERHVGARVSLRVKALASGPDGVVLEDEGIGRIRAQVAGDPAWKGQRLLVLGRFLRPAEGGLPEIEVERDAAGRPLIRVEEGYAGRRRWMYGVSFGVVALLAWAFLREHEVLLPGAWFRRRPGRG